MSSNKKQPRTGLREVSNDRILIKANYTLIPVQLDEILFIKALSDYVVITTSKTKYITLATMKDMANNLPTEVFVRSHRSFIVNMDKIKFIKGTDIEVHSGERSYTIPIGRAYKKEFKASLACA